MTVCGLIFESRWLAASADSSPDAIGSTCIASFDVSAPVSPSQSRQQLVPDRAAARGKIVERDAMAEELGARARPADLRRLTQFGQPLGCPSSPSVFRSKLAVSFSQSMVTT